MQAPVAVDTRPASPRQLDALRLLAWHIAVRGYAPSMRELGATLKIESTNRVSELLVALERKGLITRAAKQARTIVLTERGNRAAAPPLPVIDEGDAA